MDGKITLSPGGGRKPLRGGGDARRRRARPRRASLARAAGGGRGGRPADASACRISSTISKRSRAGRIDGAAEPKITRPAGALILSDARRRRRASGLRRGLRRPCRHGARLRALPLRQKNAYTCGALGHFAETAGRGGPGRARGDQRPGAACRGGASKPVFCTNPLAFAAPVGGGPPLRHRPVVERHGLRQHPPRGRRRRGDSRRLGARRATASRRPTPTAAMQGALLAFGGTRGANIALMVEVLAAGLSGANWSLDAPSFARARKGRAPASSCWRSIRPSLDPDFAQHGRAGGAAFGRLWRPHSRPRQGAGACPGPSRGRGRRPVAVRPPVGHDLRRRPASSRFAFGSQTHYETDPRATTSRSAT